MPGLKAADLNNGDSYQLLDTEWNEQGANLLGMHVCVSLEELVAEEVPSGRYRILQTSRGVSEDMMHRLGRIPSIIQTYFSAGVRKKAGSVRGASAGQGVEWFSIDLEMARVEAIAENVDQLKRLAVAIRSSGKNVVFVEGGVSALGDIVGDSDVTQEQQHIEVRALTGAERRALLIRKEGWLSSSEVADRVGSAAGNAAQAPMRLRKSGSLLGVWHAPERAFLHPPFQFNDEGLIPEMKALLQVLPKGNGSGWRQAQWLYTHHALLNKQRPADLLPDQAEKVLEVARRQFESGADDCR